MTEEKISIKQALLAFENICREGTQKDGEYHYKGLRASSDFDGYTVFIENDYVKLTIHFHNKFDFDYTNKKERDEFLEKLNSLSQTTMR